MLLGTGVGFAVGILGTVLGGLNAFLLPEISPAKQGELLGLSAGVMLGVVFWDLYPEFWRLGPAYGAGGFLAGLAFILYLRRFSVQVNRKEEKCLHKFTKAGILLGVGIAVHNFPEGVAVGTMFVQAPFSPAWHGLAILMAVHNIPEGLAMATALKLGGARWIKIVWALFLVEVPMGLGAFFGAVLGSLSPSVGASALGFAAGAMFLLVFLELLPLAGEINTRLSVLTTVTTGLLLALLLVRITG